MNAPEQQFELARDASESIDRRVGAIDELGTANECDKLETLVLDSELDAEVRKHALSTLASPQCASTLRSIVESNALDPALREDAETLLSEAEDGSDGTPGTQGRRP